MEPLDAPLRRSAHGLMSDNAYRIGLTERGGAVEFTFVTVITPPQRVHRDEVR